MWLSHFAVFLFTNFFLVKFLPIYNRIFKLKKMRLVTRDGLLLIFGTLLLITEFYELVPEDSSVENNGDEASSSPEGSPSRRLVVEAHWKRKWYGGGGKYSSSFRLFFVTTLC